MGSYEEQNSVSDVISTAGFQSNPSDLLKLEIHQLDDLDTEGLNINVTNSSDFVVGKQTNFNGPVTIINCVTLPEDTLGQRLPSLEAPGREERVIIKDKVLTASVASTIKSHAEKQKLENKENNSPGPPRTKSPPSKLSNSYGKIPVLLLSHSFLKIPLGAWLIIITVCIGCIVAISVQLTSPAIVVDSVINVTTDKPRVYLGNHRVLSKEDWGGLIPKSVVLAATPVQYVVISHTSSQFCYMEPDCITMVRNIQSYHMSREPPHFDIIYNFLVGGDGNIYVGRGWGVRSALTSFTDGKNVDINFIGDFSKQDSPTFEQLEGVKVLIEEGVRLGNISPQYSLIAANSTYQTESPGKTVYAEIKKWPRFDPNPNPAFKLDQPIDQPTHKLRGANGTLHMIYNRTDWKAKPSKQPLRLKTPVPYVVISHTGGGQCFSPEQCISKVRYMQDFHLNSSSLADIAFSFLVGGDGNIYEGRGWFTRSAVGGLTNNKNYDINLIGDFSVENVPSQQQMDGVKALLQFGVANHYIGEDYRLVAANATTPTLSPGKNAYNIIKTWDHFDPDPLAHPNPRNKPPT